MEQQTEESWAKEALLDQLVHIQYQHQEKTISFYQSAFENLKQEFEDLSLYQKVWWKFSHPSIPCEKLIFTYIQEGKMEKPKSLPFEKGLKVFYQNLQRARQTWVEIQHRKQILETWICEIKKSPEPTVSIPQNIKPWLNLGYHPN